MICTPEYDPIQASKGQHRKVTSQIDNRAYSYESEAEHKAVRKD